MLNLSILECLAIIITHLRHGNNPRCLIWIFLIDTLYLPSRKNSFIYLLTLTELLFLSNDFFVYLQHGERAYHYRRAEAATSADEVRERHECLGLGSVTEGGRQILGGRRNTIVYEEGLQPQCSDDLLGGS